MARLLYLSGITITLILVLFSWGFSQENITITTYYPSPAGSYNELGTNKLAVSITGVAVPSEYAAMQIGDAHIGRSLIIGAGGGSGYAFDEGATPGDGDVLIKGDVGIGTTNPASTWKVQVVTSGTQTAIRADAFNGSGVNAFSTNGIGVYGHSDGTGVISSGVMGVGGSYGVYGQSYTTAGGSGNAVAGNGDGNDFYAIGPGTDYGSSSSKRWKKNITSIDNPVEKVLKLRGVYFDWIEERGGRHDIGMIAEEVGKVLPEIVTYEPDGVYTLGMDYSRLTPLLVEAVKELHKENQALRQKIEALESKFKKIK